MEFRSGKPLGLIHTIGTTVGIRCVVPGPVVSIACYVWLEDRELEVSTLSENSGSRISIGDILSKRTQEKD